MIHDAIVIGAGINGLTIAHCLRRRHPDARIALLERFGGPAPDRASSHGLIRVTRSVYPTAAEVLGMVRSLEEWRLLEQELSCKLIHFRPMCLFGEPSGAIAEYAAALAEVAAEIPALAVRRLDSSQAAAQYPEFVFDPDDVVLDDRTAGTILASQTIRRLVAQLNEAAVELRYGERVIDFERVADGYRVRTDAGELRARQLIVAAGPWMPELVSCSRDRVTPIRQTVAYLRISGLPSGTGLGEFPTWAHIGSGANPIHYGLPAHAGQGLKVARHQTQGGAADLEATDLALAADPDDVRRLVDFVREHLRATDVELIETERCLYSCSAAEQFIVDWLDESRQGIVVGAGNGHMFKWAPFIGRMVADMLTEGEPGFDEARRLLPAWSL